MAQRLGKGYAQSSKNSDGETGKKVSLIPILKQIMYLEISSASLFPFLWLCLRCLSLVNQLWLQTLLTEFLKILATVLAGSGPRRKQVTIFRLRVCS